jgi:signal transduction histidine kinase
MSERRLQAHLHRSIFVRLLAIMGASAALLMVSISIVLWLLVVPTLTMARHLVADYARTLAATSPDLATARRLAARFDLQIRYEGPRGAWATSPDLPSIRDVHPGWDVFVAPGGQGGTYLVAWRLGRSMRAAHARMIWLHLLIVLAVLATAYALLRRSLRPLRLLYDGVTRLSEGQLDVVVPCRTRDEFGALTEAFNQMVRRIREMLAARDQLLLDVSHELRSPLTRMKVALALLPDGEKSRRIAADVAEMEAMITELLELERLREGKGIKTTRQDLLPILREVVESYADRAPGVELAGPGLEILLDFDGDRLRTVLRNLLDNAIKYSLPDSGPVEVSVVQGAETVAIRVADDGPGIPESDLGSLFEPFFRVDRSRSKKSGGYGLGLSICKRIMEAHGGSVAAENRSGRGAVFTLTLRKPG